MDRDGTINEEVDYLSRPADLRLIAGAARAIARLNAAGFLCIVITNQSGIARGKLDEAQLARIHERLDELLAEEGARIDGYEYCPHHPQHGDERHRRECDCRKPLPGMMQRATREFDIDLARSWVVGDSARDLDAGAALGVPGLLVSTGKAVDDAARERYTVVSDLAEAVERILA